MIDIRHISKKFGNFYANKDISLTIGEGEIHAIAGENGAGKTTLMNILFGRVRPDTGSIYLNRKPVSFRGPGDAIRAGLGMVHQNILTFPQLSVLENIVTGSEPSHAGLLKIKEAREQLLRLQELFGFHVDLDRPARELPFAQRQQIEIMRALYRGGRILILDEPTSLLSPEEAQRLLEMIKSLRAGGRTVLFISHRLNEVFSVADRITVLRHGGVAAVLDSHQTDPSQIAGLMVGRPSEAGTAADREEQSYARHFSGAFPQQPALELRDLCLRQDGTEPAVRNVSLTVSAGEIFGFAGIVGNGQRSLARALAGKMVPESGKIALDGLDVSKTGIAERLRKGVRRLPENPVEEALLPLRPLWENFVLGFQRTRDFARLGFLRMSNILRFCQDQIQNSDIAASDAYELLASLSGGNRQKVALALTLAASPKLVVLEQPTRGLDLHAARRVHDRIRKLSREKMMTFIVISYDLDELLSLCDRVAVFHLGSITGMTQRDGFSRELMGKWMAGVQEVNIS